MAHLRRLFLSFESSEIAQCELDPSKLDFEAYAHISTGLHRKVVLILE